MELGNVHSSSMTNMGFRDRGASAMGAVDDMEDRVLFAGSV